MFLDAYFLQSEKNQDFKIVPYTISFASLYFLKEFIMLSISYFPFHEDGLSMRKNQHQNINLRNQGLELT